jgi:hypothetical protein
MQQKDFEKNPTFFLDKCLMKLGIEEIHFNIVRLYITNL